MQGAHLLEGEVEGPEEAGQLAHAGGQGLHLLLGQAPPPQLAPKWQPRQEAQVLLEDPQVHLTASLYHHINSGEKQATWPVTSCCMLLQACRAVMQCYSSAPGFGGFAGCWRL